MCLKRWRAARTEKLFPEHYCLARMVTAGRSAVARAWQDCDRMPFANTVASPDGLTHSTVVGYVTAAPRCFQSQDDNQSRPLASSPSSKTTSASPSATAASTNRPSEDQDTRRAMHVGLPPKSVI